MTALIKWEPWGAEWLDRYAKRTHNQLQQCEIVDEWTAMRAVPSRKRRAAANAARAASPDSSEEKTEAEEPVASEDTGKRKRRRRAQADKPKALFKDYFKVEPECRMDAYYALLGLRKRGKHATEEDLKKAYRKISIIFHPDRIQNKGGDIKKAEERYKAVQKAYDTLTDPWARKLWESGRSFDDRIPKDNEGTGNEDEFYNIYGEAFNRWAYWSAEPDPPELGNKDTPDDYVEDFYEFWYTFSSWRDFNFHGEHKLEEAETRDEKRWMAQQNAKDPKVKAAKKDEKQNIRRMVDNAHKNDPRMNRLKERRRAEKEAKKEIRRLAKQRKREKTEAAARAIQEKRDAVEKAARDALERKERTAQNAQRKLRKLQNKIKKFCFSETWERHLESGDVELLCQYATAEDLKPLVKALKDAKKGASDLLKTTVAKARGAKGEKMAAKQAEAKRREAEEAAKVAAKAARLKWNKQECELLSKAVSRFPGGTLERWDKIRKFLDKESGGGCSRSNEDIIDKVKSLSKKVKSRAKKGKRKKKEKAPPPVDENAWSKIQQKEFEKALKMCRTVAASERWDHIADLVPGKSKAECVERFKEIRAQLMAAKKNGK